MVDASSVNPFSGVEIGSLGIFATALLVIFLSFIVLLFVGLVVYYFAAKKQYWIRIHVFRLIGNNPTRVAIYRAREISFGRAGDKLWKVAPCGFSMVFKTIKWLSVGKLQTSNSEFWYWIRKDGEWINFTPTDIDKISETINVKFVQEDMRLQRLATEKLLEQRLLMKSFWEKYGNVIVYSIFFLIIAVSMVIMFYQWSKLIDKTGGILSYAIEALEKSKPQSLIPAS